LNDLKEPGPAPQTWKLTLAYDGTDFHGWQIQPGQPTIQAELQASLHRITGESPLPQGSGRTDAGVHALAQVASFLLQARIPPENLLRAFNRTMPPSIRVLETKIVPGTFHARHSAVAKTYEYRVFRDAICPPSLARYVFPCSWPMDVQALQSSAKLFEGEHDFLSFAATDPDLTSRNFQISDEAETEGFTEGAGGGTEGAGGFNPRIKPTESTGASAPDAPSSPIDRQPPSSAPSSAAEDWPLLSQTAIRTILSSSWEQRQTEAGELLVYRVRGNGFLHHMVRNLVGTMLDVGRGRIPADEIPNILAARNRAAAGPTAPARGLFLHSVEYDEQLENDRTK
jgi:tRNA pseudouridine38-40 synthase